MVTFLRLAFFPRGTAQHWAAIVEAVGDVTLPPARRAFAAGPLEGGWQVRQLWDTQDELERFRNRDVYLPAVADLADRGFPQPPVVHDIETIDAWVGSRRLH